MRRARVKDRSGMTGFYPVLLFRFQGRKCAFCRLPFRAGVSHRSSILTGWSARTENCGPIEVLIYESDSHLQSGPPCIAWRAVYVRYEGSETGGHGGGMTYRPRSTEEYERDNKGRWFGFLGGR